MPISFACPLCSARIAAPHRAAGRKAPCPKCQATVTVPTLEQLEAVAAALLADGDSPTSTQPAAAPEDVPPTAEIPSIAEVLAPPLNVESVPAYFNRRRIVGLTVAAATVAVAVFVLTREPDRTAPPTGPSADELAASQHAAEAKAAEKRLADEFVRLNRIQSDLKLREEELAEQRERADRDGKTNSRRDSALQAKAERLLSLGKRIDELVAKDDEIRRAVRLLDAEVLDRLAAAGVSPTDGRNEAMILYRKERDKIVAEWQRRLKSVLTELDEIPWTELSAGAPPDVQAAFRTAAQQAIQKLRSTTNAHYEVPADDLAEYERRAEKVRADRLAERKRRSEKARRDGLDYCATLRGQDLQSAHNALQFLAAAHVLHVKENLSEETVLKLWRELETNVPASRRDKVVDEIVFFVKLVGEWIPEVDGKTSHNVTVAEAWEPYRLILRKLVSDGKVK